MQPALLPHVWIENFAEGHLAGFSSYPPFEDTAYDFTILPSRTLDPLGLAGFVGSGEYFYPVGLFPPQGYEGYVLRAWRPNSGSAQRLGFLRETAIHIDAASRLRFCWWLKLTPHPARVRVELAGADGRIYALDFAAETREQWVQAELASEDFRCAGVAPAPGLRIEALTIIAEFEQGDSATFHCLAIGALSFECLRPARIEFVEPAVEINEHWPAVQARKIYRATDTLELTLRCEAPVLALHAELWEAFGLDPLCAITLESHDGLWRNVAPPPMRDFRPGPLSLRVRGEMSTGQRLYGELRLWYLPQPQALEGGGLLTAQEQLEPLRRRATQGRGEEIWANIAREAGAARNVLPPEHAPIQRFPAEHLLPQIIPYFNSLRDGSRAALLNALVFMIEGNAAAGVFARECVLRMARWQQWIHPAFQNQGRPTYYPMGMTGLRLGLAYSMLRATCDAGQREAIRDGLLRNLIQPAWDEYYAQNRIGNHTSNWISHSTGGALIALLAIEEDMPSTEERRRFVGLFAGLAEKFMAHARATFKADGSYGEGFSYQNFAMETAWPVLAALEQRYGVTHLAAALNFETSYLFALAISFHEGCDLLDMGDADDKRVDPARPQISDRVQHGRSDSGANRVTSSNWAWLLQHTRDPQLKWFYDRGAGLSWEDFLWLDESIASTPPDTLPLRHEFAEKGNLVLRAGWSEADALFVLRAGANYNHTHADQGNFRLRYAGCELVCEGGKSSYYTDPYYWSYFIQAAAHNVLLIDDNPESQEIGDFLDGPLALNRRAAMERPLLKAPVAYVRCRLESVYRGLLREYTRTLVQLPGGEFVIHDRVRSAGEAHQYQWQLHPPSAEAVRLGEGEARFALPESGLRIVAALPLDATWRLKPTPIPINEFDTFPQTAPAARAVLQIENESPRTNVDYVVLLASYAQQAGSTKQAAADAWRRRGAGFERELGETHEWFDVNAESGMPGIVVTDGSYVWLRRTAGVLTDLACLEATHADMEGVSIFRAQHTLNVFQQTEAGLRRWWVQTDSANRITLDGNFRADPTGLQGVVLSQDRKGLTIDLEPGWLSFETRA